MKNKLSKIKENISKRIKKLDAFVDRYKSSAVNTQIPNMAYTNWGIQLADEGRLDDALDKFYTASLMINQHPSVYVNIGIALMKQQKFEEAIKNFRKAIKLDKSNSKAYAMWASSLSEIGDLDGAIKI